MQEQQDPASFREAVAGLRTALDQVGWAGFLKLAQAGETAAKTVVRKGTVVRFKQRADKQWLTLGGKVSVSRRLFQPDRGGPSWLALDEHCGRVGRFMVPELERVTAFLGARLVPAQVEDSLAELLPEGPSCTAIQHLLAAVGQHAEEAADALEEAREAHAPLDPAADTLVVSWDGIHVPLREVAPKRGRPPERPQASDPPTTTTAWREAAVGVVATYATPLDPENEAPERVDMRYASRMPEAKMKRLIDGVVDLTERTLQRGSFLFRIFLADGKREIWRRVDEQPMFADFIPILDFYHAADHLSKAAEHLFGKASSKADHWVTSWRHKLCHEEGAADRLLRSLTYHRGKLKKSSQRYRQVDRRDGLLSSPPRQDGVRRLPGGRSDHLQWAGGGRGQNHPRTSAQTQGHALDKKRRPANSQPPRSRAVQALGSILGMAPTTRRPTGGRHGCVNSRLHPIKGIEKKK